MMAAGWLGGDCLLADRGGGGMGLRERCRSALKWKTKGHFRYNE